MSGHIQSPEATTPVKQLPHLPPLPLDFGDMFHNLSKLFSDSISLPSSPVDSPTAPLSEPASVDGMVDNDSGEYQFEFAGFLMNSPNFFVPNRMFATVDLHHPMYLNLHSTSGDCIAVLKCEIRVALSPLTVGKTKHKGEALYLLPGHHVLTLPEDENCALFWFVMKSLDHKYIKPI